MRWGNGPGEAAGSEGGERGPRAVPRRAPAGAGPHRRRRRGRGRASPPPRSTCCGAAAAGGGGRSGGVSRVSRHARSERAGAPARLPPPRAPPRRAPAEGRGGDAEERGAALRREGAGDERLPRARRAEEQQALRATQGGADAETARKTRCELGPWLRLRLWRLRLRLGRAGGATSGGGGAGLGDGAGPAEELWVEHGPDGHLLDHLRGVRGGTQRPGRRESGVGAAEGVSGEGGETGEARRARGRGGVGQVVPAAARLLCVLETGDGVPGDVAGPVEDLRGAEAGWDGCARGGRRRQGRPGGNCREGPGGRRGRWPVARLAADALHDLRLELPDRFRHLPRREAGAQARSPQRHSSPGRSVRQRSERLRERESTRAGRGACAHGPRPGARHPLGGPPTGSPFGHSFASTAGLSPQSSPAAAPPAPPAPPCSA